MNKKLINNVREYWMKFVYKIGVINTYILLFIVYFLLIGVYSMFYKGFKLFKVKKNNKSFWKEKVGDSSTLVSVGRQF